MPLISGKSALKLSDFKPVSPDNDAFIQYWLSLPKDGLVPRRRDFDPAAIPKLLPRIILHEIIDRERLHLRLVGTMLVERYGMDITGKNYLDYVPEERREPALRAMNLAVEYPAAMAVRMNIKSAAGRICQAESVGLPMTQGPDKNPLIIFHSVEVENFGHLGNSEGVLKHFGVSGRTYLDIGAGVPPQDPDEKIIEKPQNDGQHA